MKSPYHNDYMVRVHKANGKSVRVHKSTLIILQRIAAVAMMVFSLAIPLLMKEGFEITILMWCFCIPMFLSDDPTWFYFDPNRRYGDEYDQ